MIGSMLMPTRAMHMAMREFLGLRFSNGLYMACKKEVNTCHGVVEVEFYGFETHPSHHALKSVALLVLQGKHIANLKQPIRNLALVLKNLLRHLYQGPLIVGAVCFCCRYAKREGVADLHTSKVGLKRGNHHAYAIDKGERFAAVSGFNLLPFGSALIEGVVD